MKKRNISIFLVLIMLFSIGVSGPVAYAQYADVPDMDAPGQEDSIENTEQGNTPGMPEDEDMQNPPAQGGEDETKTDTDGDKPPAQTEDSETEFDETKPFTMLMLDEADNVDTYEIDMEETGIGIDKFIIESQDKDGDSGTCTLNFPDEVKAKGIKVGELKNNVPALLSDEEHTNEHAYAYAYVENTEVFYVGHLTVHDGNKTEEYTVYTTDKHIDKRTVYVVLKEGEKISLVYRHGKYYTVDYQFQNMRGETIQEGREDSPWTYDKIFGHDRVRSVASGDHFNGTVTIPRGYKATVTVQEKGNTGEPLHKKQLGEMMAYWQPNASTGGFNTISLVKDSPDSMVLKDSFAIKDVTSDMVVNVQYEKVNEIKFNARMWTKTDYAKNRIEIMNSNGQYGTASDENSALSTQGNSFTWNFNGITSSDGNTWEMDQLEINGEPIAVPMVSITDRKPATAKTTLSTGTVITLTVTSIGGTNNGRDVKRAYTLKAENCYEDLTISNGNMVGHIHREFATRALIGVEDPQYWHGLKEAKTDKDHPDATWIELKKNTLIDKRNGKTINGINYTYNISAPFRMKLADGYEKLNVTFTDKESNILQHNDEKPNKETYIVYLNRRDGDSEEEKKVKGEYDVVTYDEWKPSQAGYYYCRATEDLDKYMKKEAKNGVVLLWFYAESQKYGIDYQNGAKEDGSAPNAGDIDNFPTYQNGGVDGYNLLNNTKALVSNRIPIDASGKFVFDHWEILTVKDGAPTDEAKKDKDNNTYTLEAGGSLPLSKKALEELSDCLYYNNKEQRNTLTLRAVWRNAKGNEPIPYTVNYYITEIQNGKQVGEPILLESHQHTANVGATLVADLWQDGNKTLSPIITEILKGDNNQKEDYTEDGKFQYIIYEPLTNKTLTNLQKGNDTVNIYLVKQPNLTVGKTVTGEYGDLTQKFNFTITLQGKNETTNEDVPINGIYAYTGGTVENVTGVTAPAGGNLNFENGQAQIELSHGQQITFTNLPFGCYYTVTENQTDYTQIYNGNKEGKLESDQTVSVVNTKGKIPVTGITDDTKKFQILLLIGTVALLLPVAIRVRRIRRKI